MRTSRKIALALIGLVAAGAVSVPLVQRLSIELVQLQIRDQQITGDQTLPEIGASFSVPYDELADRLPLEGVSDEAKRSETIATLAAGSGESLPDFKHRVVDAIFSYQFKDADVWNAWGWVSSTDGEAREQ